MRGRIMGKENLGHELFIRAQKQATLQIAFQNNISGKKTGAMMKKRIVSSFLISLIGNFVLNWAIAFPPNIKKEGYIDL